MQVLVVDDDADLVDLLGLLLVEAGAERCVLAHSLDEVTSQREDALGCELAILDINLGAGRPSGLAVHRWLRECGFKGRIVFLTGHAHGHALVQAAARAPDAQVVAKPLRADDLTRLLGRP